MEARPMSLVLRGSRPNVTSCQFFHSPLHVLVLSPRHHVSRRCGIRVKLDESVLESQIADLLTKLLLHLKRRSEHVNPSRASAELSSKQRGGRDKQGSIRKTRILPRARVLEI